MASYKTCCASDEGFHQSCQLSAIGLEAFLKANSLKPLLKLFRLQRDTTLSCRFLLPVVADPRFPAFARSHIATSKSQSGDIGIGNENFRTTLFGQQAHETIRQGFASAT